MNQSMKQVRKKHHFKRNETGYHKLAVRQLAKWVKGRVEYKFTIDERILFVADVVTLRDGFVDCIYEVVYTHPIDGKKLGRIQYWSYRNSKEFIVYEVTADFILSQMRKPEKIQTKECYVINLFDKQCLDTQKIKVA